MGSRKTAAYLDEQQREGIKRLARSWLWRSELPTWGLIVVVYGGWFLTLASWQLLGLLPATLLLVWFTTWYLSLQHELIHGHPTRCAWFNHLLGVMPLAVWYPFGLYRDLHLAHHDNETLTLPGRDPETYYFSARAWQNFSVRQKQIIRWRNTFAGRLLLAPALDILQTLNSLISALRNGQRPAIRMWLVHGVLLAALSSWMAQRGFPVWYFIVAVSYPALAITKVRSFLEHQAAEDPLARSVITETSFPWRLLFLNLNYHSVHHDLPGIPWYGLRKIYLLNREDYQRRNHGFVVKGYGEWMRQFFMRPLDVDLHPSAKADSRVTEP
ncbi:MAG TPA: fatty acid desaturase [Buttiauxella sp.]|jgi:fatty acid desaturase